MAIEDFIISTLNLSSNQIKQLNVKRKDDTIEVYITLNPLYPECPECGGKVNIKEYKSVTYNHLPVVGHKCIIIWNRRRYVCKDCKKTFSEPSPFGPEGFHQTYAVLDQIAKDLHSVHATYKDIAMKRNVSPTIVQLYSDSYIHAPHMPLPENLGIDEIHSGMAKYGGAYLCVFVDNQRRELNDILPDRSKVTLSRHFDKIPQKERDRVKWVTIDMWQPYADTAHRYFRYCKVAVDSFHVIKHLTDSFDSLRIQLMNQSVYNSPEYYLLKHWNKLLLSDKYNLDNEPQYNGYFRTKMNYRDLKEMLLNINSDLREAYELKELYRDFNKKCTYEDAPAQMEEILQTFESSDLHCYDDFIELLKNWKEEIINSFERPYDNRRQSNALAESVNQKLRQLINTCSGFANFERFRARSLYCLNDRFYYSITSHLSSLKREGKKRGTYNKNKDLIKNTKDPFENDGPVSDQDSIKNN